MEHWQPVEFAGPDDLDARIYQGHPGRVIDLGQYPSEVSVGFVNGPSWCLPADRLRLLSEAQYLERGRRLVALIHPVRDAPVPRFNAEGQEWIDGKEPVPPQVPPTPEIQHQPGASSCPAAPGEGR